MMFASHTGKTSSKLFLKWALGMCARAIIKKYNPRIVAITGSVGKTTTRAAVAAALGTAWRVRASAKNFNNELGVPFTIIGADAPGRSPFAWCGIFLKALWLLIWHTEKYPQLLVLEMGADHPGDIAHLIRIAPPHVGVLTSVSPAHTEFFGSVDGVLAEKKIMITSLPSKGTAVINGDDELVMSVATHTNAHVVTFGMGDSCEVRIRAVETEYDAHGVPCATVVHLDGLQACAVRVNGVLGIPVAQSVAAGVAVASALGCTSEQIQDGLRSFAPPPSRMRIIAGIKNTTLIDDTYNSSPRAAREALHTLAQTHSKRRRIAILGDMRELGALSDSLHEEIGTLVASLPIDVLITVGASARMIARGARAAGMLDDRIFSFDTSPEAGKFVQERMQEGDLILIKGSQGIRCEKIVKEVMAAPERAEELIVRQGTGWN